MYGKVRGEQDHVTETFGGRKEGTTEALLFSRLLLYNGTTDSFVGWDDETANSDEAVPGPVTTLLINSDPRQTGTHTSSALEVDCMKHIIVLASCMGLR